MDLQTTCTLSWADGAKDSIAWGCKEWSSILSFPHPVRVAVTIAQKELAGKVLSLLPQLILAKASASSLLLPDH